MTAPTAAQRGRRNRANGAAYEVKLANYLKAWWPDACRAVRSTHPDPGDIDNTSPSLWWSMKNVDAEQLNAWFAEMDDKASDRIGLLVVRRRGYADPGRWWCWMRTRDVFDALDVTASAFGVEPDDRCRLELHAVVRLLVSALNLQAATAPMSVRKDNL